MCCITWLPGIINITLCMQSHIRFLASEIKNACEARNLCSVSPAVSPEISSLWTQTDSQLLQRIWGEKKNSNIKRRTKYNLLLLLCRDIAVDCALRRGRGWGGLRACRIIWVLERKRLLIRMFPFCFILRYLLTSRVWTIRGIPSWSRERRYSILRKSLFGKVANVFTNSVAGLKYGKRNTAAKTPFLASVVYFFMLLWRFRPF